MTFSNYHLYVDLISRIDHMIGQFGGIGFIALECLFIVKVLRPQWLKYVVWLLIGGFYASLLVLVANGGLGA